jgi:hypothetical protein
VEEKLQKINKRKYFYFYVHTTKQQQLEKEIVSKVTHNEEIQK